MNKNFNEVISGSRKLISRFILHISGHDENQHLEEIATLRRRYQKISFVNMNCSQMKIATAGIEQVGCNATEIFILASDAPKSRQLLPCFPDVVKLELCFISGSIETLSPTLFPKLKHLKLHDAVNVSTISDYTNQLKIILIHRFA